MTKEDYKIIAKIIKEWINSYDIPITIQPFVDNLIRLFIIELKKDNPRFDEKSFIKQFFKGF